MFKNGILEQKDDIIKIKGPTKNLEDQGFFKTPKTIRTIKIDESKDYFNSLNDSVSYFLNHVKHKRSFNKKIIDISINSNSLII